MKCDAAAVLRGARERSGLSQAELARRAGVAQPMISAYETGRRAPSISMLSKLVEATGHDLSLDLVVRNDRRRGLPDSPMGRRLRRRRQAILTAAERRGASNVRVFGSLSRSFPACTTADSRLHLFARRVSAASPLGRYTRWSRSAHRLQTSPGVHDLQPPTCAVTGRAGPVVERRNDEVARRITDSAQRALVSTRTRHRELIAIACFLEEVGIATPDELTERAQLSVIELLSARDCRWHPGYRGTTAPVLMPTGTLVAGGPGGDRYTATARLPPSIEIPVGRPPTEHGRFVVRTGEADVSIEERRGAATIAAALGRALDTA